VCDPGVAVKADSIPHDTDLAAAPPAGARTLARRAALLATALLVAAAGVPAPAMAASESEAAKEPETAAVWQRLVPETNDFSILLPGDPSLLVKRNQTIVGPVTESKYVVEVGEGHVSVETHVLPKIAMLLAPARIVLERAKQQILETHSAQEISYTALADSRYRGARLLYRPQGSDLEVQEVRLILSKNRLYLLTAALPSGKAMREIVSRFFDSFRIGRSDPSEDS
jgi:hypothetical protein